MVPLKVFSVIFICVAAILCSSFALQHKFSSYSTANKRRLQFLTPNSQLTFSIVSMKMNVQPIIILAPRQRSLWGNHPNMYKFTVTFYGFSLWSTQCIYMQTEHHKDPTSSSTGLFSACISLLPKQFCIKSLYSHFIREGQSSRTNLTQLFFLVFTNTQQRSYSDACFWR